MEQRSPARPAALTPRGPTGPDRRDPRTGKRSRAARDRQRDRERDGRDSEGGASYEVEVTREDGSTVDVRLDDGFEVIAVEGEQGHEESDGDD